MKKYGSIALLAALAMLSACEKNAVQELLTAPADANIKFFNFGINAPGVNFYADATKMTAISSTTGVESTTGTAYGSVANGGFYSTIAAGSHVFTGRIAATTDKDLAISTLTAPVASGKYYSLYQSGFYNTTAKTIDSFLIDDPLPDQIDFTKAQVRFVNASPNSTPLTLIVTATLDSAKTTIGGPVTYKSAGAFVPVPSGNYDIVARVTGSSSNAILRTGVSFLVGHMYTITARGDMTVTSTTATNRPFLDNTANR
jgi:hypothetical protein